MDILQDTRAIVRENVVEGAVRKDKIEGALRHGLVDRHIPSMEAATIPARHRETRRGHVDSRNGRRAQKVQDVIGCGPCAATVVHDAPRLLA
jgi:hypothetical protein